jgi:GNAT superfamily N-acetyltransferase
MTFELRPACDSDHEFLHRLNRAAYEDLALRLFGEWSESVKRERLSAKILQGGYQVVVVAGHAVGAIWCSEVDDHFVLRDVMLMPDSQRRGLGTRILHDQIQRSLIAGKPLRLHTSILNDAQSLYRRLGFAEVGRDGEFIDFEYAAGNQSAVQG